MSLAQAVRSSRTAAETVNGLFTSAEGVLQQLHADRPLLQPLVDSMHAD
jgi:hypothetical protein